MSIKDKIKTRKFMHGTYSVTLTVIVIIVAVVLNLLVAKLPETWRSVDMTEDNLYSIGDDTKAVLDGLDTDITITVLADEDDADTVIKSLVEKYKDASSHISVEYVDPSLNADSTSDYANYSTNSVIVATDTAQSVIDYYDIYATDYSSYYTTGTASTSFDGEGQITGAIYRLTSDSAPVAYCVTNHGETELSSSLNSMFQKQNITVESLDLMSESIPEDASLIIINAPTMDYSADEAQELISYVDNGGKLAVLCQYSTDTDFPNLNSILYASGISVTDGVVMEGSSSYYQYPINVIAGVDSCDITSGLDANSNILISATEGLTTSEKEGITFTSLLTSSGSSYTKLPDASGQLSTFDKESGDQEGPFDLAVLAENENGGALLAIGGSSLIDEYITGYLPVANLDFFMDCAAYMTGGDDSTNVSIAAKSMDPEYITVTGTQTGMWMLLCIVLIPLCIFIAGLVIWLVRRKK